MVRRRGKRAYGDVIPSPWGDRRILVTKEPVGLWSRPSRRGISPPRWIGRKLGAALAAGCTIVIKPASQTPFSALACVLCEKAGVPAGVVNIVNRRRKRDWRRTDLQPRRAQDQLTGSTEIASC